MFGIADRKNLVWQKDQTFVVSESGAASVLEFRRVDGKNPNSGGQDPECRKVMERFGIFETKLKIRHCCREQDKTCAGKLSRMREKVEELKNTVLKQVFVRRRGLLTGNRCADYYELTQCI